MKKSELKSLLRIIAEEVIAVKQQRLNEAKEKKSKASLKEEIVEMIREAIDESNIEEMARTAGAVAPEYRKEIEPGKWVIMGHPNQEKFPDGTPTTAPKGKYVKKGQEAPAPDSLPIEVDGRFAGEINFKLPSGKVDPTPIIAKLNRTIYSDKNIHLAAYKLSDQAYAKADELQGKYYDSNLKWEDKLKLKLVGDELVPV